MTGDLLGAVAGILNVEYGPSAVRAVEPAPAELASSYPAHLVTVTLTGGRRLTLFLKDLSTRRYDRDLAQRRSLEIAVYRDLLAGAGLGTARYYGSVVEPDRNRYWLLLEHVDGECLRYQPFERWLPAAAWLGRLQAHVAGGPAVAGRCRQLRPVAAGRYLATAEAAWVSAAGYGAGLAARVGRALAGYPDLVARLAAAPPTLVHGSFRPQNILIAPAPDGGVRVCPVDWETAALGPAGYDLAYLSDGFDDERRRLLVEAYRAEAARHGLALPAGRQAGLLLAGCDLDKHLKTLAKAVDRDFPPAGVERLVGMVEAAAARAVPARRLAGSPGLTPTGPATRPTDGVAATVRELLARRLDRPVVVTELTRSASRFASRAPAEVLSATVAGGASYRLFLKRCGGAEPDHPDKQRRDRELRVYSDLFAGRDLPVPQWIGGGWNPAAGRHDLYLEHIDDWDLRYQSLRYWYLAAGRLGRLHGTLARARADLATSDFLLRLDAGYFDAWAGRALDAVRPQSRRLARRYERVVTAFRSGSALLAAEPTTLVHNDLSPKNVLVDRASRPARVCVVDWELAGIGCGLLDLAQLGYGLRPAEAARLHACYYRAVRGSDLLPSRRSTRLAVLAACRIHQTNVRLWCSPRWSLPDGRLAGWVTEAETLIRRVP
jgi:aminoglycoside phosphotransferase (APT) family kinase protein